MSTHSKPEQRIYDCSAAMLAYLCLYLRSPSWWVVAALNYSKRLTSHDDRIKTSICITDLVDAAEYRSGPEWTLDTKTAL